MTVRPVVVGVDGSQHSQRALAWAIDYAKLSGASLRIVCAWEIAPHYSMSSYDDPTYHRQAAEEVVASVTGAVPDDLPSEAEAIFGHPAGVLIHESENASLLVLGSRGRGGFADMLLGSVSGYCSHHASCPVVLVREY
jgi:nucleotide-binding universal stress UspA family protein